MAESSVGQDPLWSSEHEANSGTVAIVFGCMVGFLALVALVLNLLGRAPLSLVLGGSVCSIVLISVGLWLRRRSRRTDVARFGPWLAFWSTYAPLTVLAGLSYLAAPTWLRLVFFLVTLSLATLWYFAVARRGARPGGG